MPPITQETLVWAFKDPDWKSKFLIGSAIALAARFVPLVGILAYFAIYGYCLIMLRAVLRGAAPMLPKWENFGDLFVDGFKSGLAAIGYWLPGMLAMICAYSSMFVMIFADAVTRVSATRDAAQRFPWGILAGYAGFFGFFAIAMVLMLLLMFPMVIAVGQYARTGEIGAGYRISEVWKILRANLGGFIIAFFIGLAIAVGLGMVLQILYFTIILCCLIPFVSAPISFYMTLMWSYLFGMAYREGALKAGLLANPG
ncbi:MAG: DUF4013 domain-containing protein [Chloroflexi bacterium]|nr:DUF4013 domain-containing protein [Chloroflexota bacterium]